jgi:hypothetical protein
MHFDNMEDFFSGNVYDIRQKTLTPDEISFSTSGFVMKICTIKQYTDEETEEKLKTILNHWMTGNHRPFMLSQ